MSLEDVVASAKFLMPGWDVKIGKDLDGTGWDTLIITSWTPDSYDTSKMLGVNHPFLIPPATYADRVWKAWLMERFCDVMRHEVGEMLEFDGVKEFAPHHANGEDPYITWHVGDLADTRVKAGQAK